MYIYLHKYICQYAYTLISMYSHAMDVWIADSGICSDYCRCLLLHFCWCNTALVLMYLWHPLSLLNTGQGSCSFSLVECAPSDLVHFFFICWYSSSLSECATSDWVLSKNSLRTREPDVRKVAASLSCLISWGDWKAWAFCEYAKRAFKNAQSLSLSLSLSLCVCVCVYRHTHTHLQICEHTHSITHMTRICAEREFKSVESP